MTGDNNGRWAGNYSWPDDTQSYLRNAKSTILSLRPHASLLLWCAGNELHPEGQNPNTAVATGLQQLLVELDPLRYYVQSSMSPQSSNPALFDVKYALAPQVSCDRKKSSIFACSEIDFFFRTVPTISFSLHNGMRGIQG